MGGPRRAAVAVASLRNAAFRRDGDAYRDRRPARSTDAGAREGAAARPLQRLLPWGVAGFVINLVTGIIFYSGDPFQYIDNNVFWLKMGFIALAGVNVLLFYATGLSRRVRSGRRWRARAWRGARRGGRVALLWFGVMYWGRMLPFLGGAF